MKEVLKAHILQKLGDNITYLEEVLNCFQPIRYKRNEMILREGEICRYCNFIVKGCVQVFVYDREGNEMTRDFTVEEGWVMEINSFAQQIPARENLRAVEPTHVLAISPADFQSMMQLAPQFGMIYRQIMEMSYTNSVFRLNTFIAMDGLERLKWAMEHQPKLMTRLSGKAIASYLGISPETLTRLKAKL